MTTTKHERPVGTPETGELRARAWAGVVLIPVGFLLAFAVGEGLYSLLGYKPENDDAPLWADLVVNLPTLAVVLLPCAAAVFYGRRGHRVGERGALVPAAIGLLAGGAFTVLTIVTTIAGEL